MNAIMNELMNDTSANYAKECFQEETYIPQTIREILKELSLMDDEMDYMETREFRKLFPELREEITSVSIDEYMDEGGNVIEILRTTVDWSTFQHWFNLWEGNTTIPKKELAQLLFCESGNRFMEVDEWFKFQTRIGGEENWRKLNIFKFSL
jgi:hypothetical protein